MADLAVSDWAVTIPSRHNRRLVEGVREVFATCVIGDGSKTVPSGGIPMPALGVFGIHKEVNFMNIADPGNGYVFAYDYANNKMLVLYGDYDPAAAGPLVAYTGALPQTTLRIKIEGN